jgi:hypothetical protein
MTQDQINACIARYRNATPSERLAMKQRRLERMIEDAQYADHGAYGQDRRAIAELRREIAMDQMRLTH